uniref:Uncharacterized protein n=1 Tax=Arundo donax TaxID=35708 RepID=A0A0A8YMH7_ARUDO
MATWEDYYVIKERCPSAAAWGHAASQGGGDVTPGDNGVMTNSTWAPTEA